TLSMSAQANANVDAANPGASSDQKAGMMTESGLTYGKNASVNETADRYSSAGSTGEFVDNYELSFFDNLVSMAEGNLENYSAIQIADISANSQARGSDKSVRLTFSAPGVKTGSRVMVARIRDGSMEFVNSSAGNGTISLDVDAGNLGSIVLTTRMELCCGVRFLLAGIPSGIDSRYGAVGSLCGGYVTSGWPAVTVRASEREIRAEQGVQAGHSRGYCESLCLYLQT